MLSFAWWNQLGKSLQNFKKPKFAITHNFQWIVLIMTFLKLIGVAFSILSNATNDMDKMFSSFYSEFNKIVTKHAPMKTLSRREAKRCSKPRITKWIRTSIKIKNKLYLSGNDAKYKFYINKICSLTRISKKQFFFEYFQANINNMKKTWIGINNIFISCKRTFPQVPPNDS